MLLRSCCGVLVYCATVPTEDRRAAGELLILVCRKVFTWLSELLSHLRWVHSAPGAGQPDLQTQKNRETVKLSVRIHYEDLMLIKMCPCQAN